MLNLKFVQITKENKELCAIFSELLKAYSLEIDSHLHRTTPEKTIHLWCESIIKKQEDKERHLEICYDGENIIGFLYGKIDRKEHKGFTKPGYGYVMEFYVLPQYRLNGYGKKMFYHLQNLFIKDGAEKIYLTSDPITGKPFWEALGFKSFGEKSPENNLDIYEKNIFPSFTFKTIKFPTEEMLNEIAKEQGDFSQRIVQGMTKIISQAHYNSNHFMVKVSNYDSNIIGCANFIQNSKNSYEWLYTDLWVHDKYRRQGIATKILKEGLQHLAELDAEKLLCTVSPGNNPSLKLQNFLGFSEVSLKQFEDLETDGMKMFETIIKNDYNITQFTDDYNQTLFLCQMSDKKYDVRQSDLFKELRHHLLSNDGKSEVNYFVRKGVVIIASIKFILGANSSSNYSVTIHPKFNNKSLNNYITEFINKKSLLLEEKVIPKVSDEV